MIGGFQNLTQVNKRKQKKARFTQEEDEQLLELVSKYGQDNWSLVASKMNNRNERQVRDRWRNNLCPEVNKNPWTEEEDSRLVELYNELGPRWVKIASLFENRTDVSLKSRWLVLKRKEKHTVEPQPKQQNSSPDFEKVKDTIELMACPFRNIENSYIFLNHDFGDIEQQSRYCVVQYF